ncbi:4-hydroxy-tetrahydrodipicolinate synthase [Pelagirhabdus alkalitolerans]|uniref:4-hydroxy-tetrahydrodipicolinate synthase n=1 Tax=Pelagirhabdus alkalitolerans TaxID=1612202 RepID=A0A1G6H4P9_9BACI|nr:4-hydroxy-tetrahydrodipicolinate synthase [Pelagirhabdus alkalitolerans]SDB89151.1 4-hydroxy-tetrahydrodipicolinate synthase [Pelagirhabdus alkalitolerans]
MNFGQLLTAMVTPFNENNEIDFDKVTELMNHLMDSGTDGIVVAGTTGESPTLTHDEKIQLFEHTVNIANGRVPIIAGTGSNNTKETIKLTKEAQAIGVDASLLVTPYYNKPNQAGLYQHFLAVAEATSLPIMMYNIPGRTMVHMTVETIVALSKIENIVSIKESSGNLDAISQVVDQTDEDFTVYSGDDSLTLPLKSIGADGVVSVSSHIVGNEMKEMLDAFNQGNVKRASEIHRQLLPIMRGLFIAPSPAPVKAALRMKGIDTGTVRLPLVNVNEVEEQLIRDLI